VAQRGGWVTHKFLFLFLKKASKLKKIWDRSHMLQF